MYNEDIYYMKKAIELAKKGSGYVSPNPLVGAVVVKDNQIIGEGYHEYYGGNHAERNAINDCTKSLKDATIYVTLEPCCHYGKTPPCTDAIIQSGIKKVVIGTKDLNPKVSGKSIDILRREGIEVVEGVLEEECIKLIKIFRKYISTNKPYVIMKYAMTMDGKISSNKNEFIWISAEESRKEVHNLRHDISAIMVGINTVIKDNPMLNCRYSNSINKKVVNPIRVICDTHLKTPLDSNIANTAKEITTYIAISDKNNIKKLDPYLDKGCKILMIPEKNGKIDLEKLMEELGRRGIDSVLLEGGATLNNSALKSKIVDELRIYISNKIFGEGLSPISNEDISNLADEIEIKDIQIRKLGSDIVVESMVKYHNI